LWHLSAHALREVHRRTFPADVTSNPLPAPLAEIVSNNMHAASLLSVTKVIQLAQRGQYVEETKPSLSIFLF